MKVLIVSLNYAPEPTATGKYTGELGAFLVRRGHSVDVMAAPPHYPSWKVFSGYRGRGFHSEFLDGVRVFRVPCYIPQMGRVRALTRIAMEITFTCMSLCYWARFLFRKDKYDLVISICPPLQSAILPVIYSRLRDVPCMMHVQDFQVDMALKLGMLNGRYLSEILYRIESLLLKRQDYVSTITLAMKEKAIQKGVDRERIFHFPNWADADMEVPESRKGILRQELELSPTDFIVLYSGGMGEKQGLEIVIRAAKLTESQPNIRYLVVGDGGAKSHLMQLASLLGLSNVIFMPLQPFEKVPEMLALSDVGLIVQRAEAADYVMPSKLSNILSAGRPVIATADANTELADVITNYKIGLIVEPESAEALAVAIVEMCGNKEAREQMGESAKCYAEANLSKSLILSRFEERLLAIKRDNFEIIC